MMPQINGVRVALVRDAERTKRLPETGSARREESALAGHTLQGRAISNQLCAHPEAPRARRAQVHRRAPIGHLLEQLLIVEASSWDELDGGGVERREGKRYLIGE